VRDDAHGHAPILLRLDHHDVADVTGSHVVGGINDRFVLDCNRHIALAYFAYRHGRAPLCTHTSMVSD
jgi:hypothetical protein